MQWRRSKGVRWTSGCNGGAAKEFDGLQDACNGGAAKEFDGRQNGTSNLVWAYEPQTENGAACPGTTGTSNVNLFGTRFILFDGSTPVSTPESSRVISVLRERLDAAYTEDPVLAIRNVLYLGNLRDGGANNHSAYMVGLVFLWEKHPRTFIANVMPFIAENSCARDLLTLLSVITPNRTFPLERLWQGEQPDASSSAGRSFLKKQEMVIWRMLLKEFGDLQSKDVVTSQVRNKRVRFQRGSSRHSSDDSSTSLPDEASDESPPGLERDMVKVGGFAKRSYDDDFNKSKRNTWHNKDFKLRWHEERAFSGSNKRHRMLIFWTYCRPPRGLGSPVSSPHHEVVTE